MATRKTPKRRGRPKGTGEFDGGILRLAISQTMADALEKLRDAKGLRSTSEAARQAIEAGCKAEAVL
jgi:hypothetical protein